MSKNKAQIEQPIARTNMLKIHWDAESVLRALMDETRGDFRVLYQRLPLSRAKNEKDEAYFIRVDAAIKQFITQHLGTSSSVQNYERIAITKDNVLFFYIGKSTSNVQDLIEWHHQNGIGLDKAIGAVLQLKLKLSYLEDVSVHYDLTLKDANSAFFIGAMETSDKEASTIIDALECKVYYSAQDEISVSVNSATFKFNKTTSTTLSAATGTVSLHKGTEQYLNGERMNSTRFSKRPFMEFKLPEDLQANPAYANAGFQNSKNYHLTMCLNKIIEELDSIGVDYSPIEFQATGVIEEFVTAKPVLKNDLVIIDCFDRYPDDEIKSQFHRHLQASFNPVAILDAGAPTAHQMKREGTSYLVLNPSNKSNGSSIVNQNGGASLNTFWQALSQSQGANPKTFDYYTEVKIARFVQDLNIVCQGIDLKSVTKTVTIKNGEDSHKETRMLELNKNIIQKAISELWLKESVFHNRSIDFKSCSIEDGDYQVFYCRRTESGLKYCNVVDLTIAGKRLTITKTKRWGTGQEALFDMSYRFLKGVGRNRGAEIFKSLHDQTFVLHQKSTGHSLISYSSSRVPKIIGNALFDNIDRHIECGIGRFRSAHETPLPYYITMTQAGKMHRVFVQDDGIEGMKYFVSGAKAIAGKIEKQSLVSNVLVYDREGTKLNAGEEDIAKLFFRSFTYDILKNKNSAKKSIFQKIAEMGLEN